MPRFSICVSSFNDADFLTPCINSVISQSFSDFELVIVDDGSTDKTSSILDCFVERDPRIKIISKKYNEGVHLGRKTAVEQSVGDYVVFLDSDDELKEGALLALDSFFCKFPECDYLHFGMDVNNKGDFDETTVFNFDKQANFDFDCNSSDDLLSSSFITFESDWRVIQRCFSSKLAKRAFASMTSEKMGRGQDAYECFVLSSMAENPKFCNSLKCYRYYLGRGITNSSSLSTELWLKEAAAYHDCWELACEFAMNKAPIVGRAAASLKLKLLESLFNDWFVRVGVEEKLIAARRAAAFCGGIESATQLFRIIRDEAYRLWDSGFSAITLE